jgi:hypothetical protein
MEEDWMDEEWSVMFDGQVQKAFQQGRTPQHRKTLQTTMDA